jgi:hypothetical protein
MKSRNFITIFVITVLFFCCLGTVKNVAAVESANATQDELNKKTIAGLLPLNISAKTIALTLYDGNVSELYSEMRRLGFTEDQIVQISANGLNLKKGAIYEKSKAVGIWNGKDAYILNSAGKLVINRSYATKVKRAITSSQTLSSNVSIATTSKIVKFVNNIASNKVINSAVYSLSRVYTKTNRGSLALKLLAADITTNNLGAKKFSGNNIFISSNAITTVLKGELSKKYIAKKDVKVNTLNSVLSMSKAILRIKNKDNKWQFIAISKISNKKVTVYENNKNQKIVVSSLTPYLKNKKFKFSGVAIAYNMKIGNTPSTANLKAAIGI